MFGNPPSAGPLAPIVSLERRKFEQMGVPPGQEQQASAASGAPISGNLAQLIQLNRMLQQKANMQQQANPAPSTVAQDLMQMAMQQPAPQMDPRQTGIANLPAGNLGTQNMARGGIVAFERGGVANQSELDDEQKAAALTAFFEAVKQTPPAEPTVESMIRQNKPGGGLASAVPTLTGGAQAAAPQSELEIALGKLKERVDPDYYKNERTRIESEYGLPALRTAREAEMARREKDLSPEAQRRAFMGNLSRAFASQIGQRGVSTSSRLAQMLGAYGTTKFDTAEQFKKLRDELNAAKLDMREKMATAQMTGEMTDRAAATAAQKAYMDALENKRTAERLEKKETADEKFRQRQLDIQQQGIRANRTAFETYAPALRQLDAQIDAARSSNDPVKLDALTKQRDALISRIQLLTPGSYAAQLRSESAGEALDVRRLQLLQTNSNYKRLNMKLQQLRQAGPKGKNPEGKPYGPGEYDAALNSVMQGILDEERKAGITAQGDAGSGSGKVIDFNDWNSK